MGLTKCLGIVSKSLFNKPGKNANGMQKLMFGLGIGYAGVKTLGEGYNLWENNTVDKSNLSEATVGFAMAAGSIFGAGGAILAGAGTKYIVEKCKPLIAE